MTAQNETHKGETMELEVRKFMVDEGADLPDGQEAFILDMRSVRERTTGHAYFMLLGNGEHRSVHRVINFIHMIMWFVDHGSQPHFEEMERDEQLSVAAEAVALANRTDVPDGVYPHELGMPEKYLESLDEESARWFVNRINGSVS